ncbi:MAG: exosortase/archaeosortase family protein [Candidatus Bathyarchaeia archaeon]
MGVSIFEGVRDFFRKENVVKLMPAASFIPVLFILYLIDPNSFSIMYPGRALYIFFIWLASFKLAFHWEKIQVRAVSKAFLIFVSLLPTLYTIIYFALLSQIGMTELMLISTYPNSPLAKQMYLTLSVEYLGFAALSALMILAFYKSISIGFHAPAFFLGAVGMVFIVDWAFPGGYFTPFQALVFPTAQVAAAILNLMGYQTGLYNAVDRTYGPLVYMRVHDPIRNADAGLGIAWPCAGVESLIIYTVTVSTFLQSLPVSKRLKILYFTLGAIVTYAINVLRIITIFEIALNGGDIWIFHNYHGWLYSTLWVVTYPLIITLLSRRLN